MKQFELVEQSRNFGQNTVTLYPSEAIFFQFCGLKADKSEWDGGNNAASP